MPDIDFSNLFFNFSITGDDVPASLPALFIKGFQTSGLYNTTITGNVVIEKTIKSDVVSITADNAVERLAYRGKLFPALAFQGKMDYFVQKKMIRCLYLRVNCPKIIDMWMAGTLYLADKKSLYMNIISGNCNLAPFLELLSLLSDAAGSVETTTFSAGIVVNLNYINLFGMLIRNVTGAITADNGYIDLELKRGELFQGTIFGFGNVDTTIRETGYSFEVSLNNTGTTELLSHIAVKNLISGRLDSKLSFSSRGNSNEMFAQNLKAEGKFSVRGGQLFGYANILKPVFTIGKLMNVLGPRGKSSEFREIKADFTVDKEMVIITKMSMKGVGIDAKGYGSIGFDKKINIRVMVGFGGLAGKIIHVPIVYRGELFKNHAYIDPIWLGSAYVGMTVLPGPLGPTAGTIISELIRDLLRKTQIEMNQNIIEKEKQEADPLEDWNK